MEVSQQWKMLCHNALPPLGKHQIEIPSPRHLALLADQSRLERENLETFFVCPQCGHASLYKGSEALCWNVVLEAGQDRPPDVYPLRIELPCVEEACRPHTQVRTTRYAIETLDQVIERLSRTDFQNATCSRGHQLSFPDDGVGVFENSDARPF
jgi:hypothetical protein